MKGGRFQFSLARLGIAITCWSVALALISALIHGYAMRFAHPETFAYFSIMGAATTMGTGFGVLAGKPLNGFWIGLCVLAPIFFCVLIYWASRH